MADLKDLWDSIRENDTADTAQSILRLPEASRSQAYIDAIADKSDIEILALQISLFAYHPQSPVAGDYDRWERVTREDFDNFIETNESFQAIVSDTALTSGSVDLTGDDKIKPVWEDTRIQSGADATVDVAQTILRVSPELRDEVYADLTKDLTDEQITAVQMSIYFHAPVAEGGLGQSLDDWNNATFADFREFMARDDMQAVLGATATTADVETEAATQAITISADPDKVISITFEGLETDAERLAFIEANREAIQTQITAAVTAHLEANDDPDGTFELLNQNWDLAYMGDDLDSTDDDNQNRATVEINSMAMDTVRTLRPAAPEAEAHNDSTGAPRTAATADGDEWFVISSTKTDAIAALQQALGQNPEYQAALGARGWTQWADGEIGSRTYGVIQDYANKHDIDPNSMSIEDFTQHVRDNIAPTADADVDPKAMDIVNDRIIGRDGEGSIQGSSYAHQLNHLERTGTFDTANGEISRELAETVALSLAVDISGNDDLTLSEATAHPAYIAAMKVFDGELERIPQEILNGEQPAADAENTASDEIVVPGRHPSLTDEDRMIDPDALEAAQAALDRWQAANPGAEIPQKGILTSFSESWHDMNDTPMLVRVINGEVMALQVHEGNASEVLQSGYDLDPKVREEITDKLEAERRDFAEGGHVARTIEYNGIRFAVDRVDGRSADGEQQMVTLSINLSEPTFEGRDGEFATTHVKSADGELMVETDELGDALGRFDSKSEVGRVMGDADRSLRGVWASSVDRLQDLVDNDRAGGLSVTFSGAEADSTAEISTSNGETIQIPKALYDAIIEEAQKDTPAAQVPSLDAPGAAAP